MVKSRNQIRHSLVVLLDLGKAPLQDDLPLPRNIQHRTVQRSVDVVILLCQAAKGLQRQTSTVGLLPEDIPSIDVPQTEALTYEPRDGRLATTWEAGNRDQHERASILSCGVRGS